MESTQKQRNIISIAMVIALEILAVESGIYTYVALHHREVSHVILLTILLCLLAAIIGRLVTNVQSKWHARIIEGLMLFGLLSTVLGIYTRIALVYHERAALAMGAGTICLLAGFSGLLLARSLRAVLYEGIVLGIVVLSVGLYFFANAYHTHVAYLVIATGLLGLICSLSATVKTTLVQPSK